MTSRSRSAAFQGLERRDIAGPPGRDLRLARSQRRGQDDSDPPDLRSSRSPGGHGHRAGPAHAQRRGPPQHRLHDPAGGALSRALGGGERQLLRVDQRRGGRGEGSAGAGAALRPTQLGGRDAERRHAPALLARLRARAPARAALARRADGRHRSAAASPVLGVLPPDGGRRHDAHRLEPRDGRGRSLPAARPDPVRTPAGRRDRPPTSARRAGRRISKRPSSRSPGRRES